MSMILKTVEMERGAFDIALSSDGGRATLEEPTSTEPDCVYEGVVRFTSHHEMAKVGQALIEASAQWRTLQGD
jgi:hypothetical protein